MKNSTQYEIEEGKKENAHYSKECIGVNSFHVLLQNSFYKLGYKIGKSPAYFIIIPVFISIFSLTGLQQMNYVSDPDFLFTPSNGEGKMVRERVETIFPLNYSENFDPSRNTRVAHFVRIFILAKDNGTMLRAKQFEELKLVDEIVHNVTFNYNDQELKYKDICAINKRKCNENSVLNLGKIISQVENGSTAINYPIMSSPYLLPFAYGGVEVDEENGHLLFAKSIALGYWTKQGGVFDKAKSDSWELQVLKTILGAKFETIRVTIFASRSLEDEVERNTFVIIPYMIVNSIFITTISVLSLMTIDWVRSKFYLGIIAVISALFATSTGFGLLMYLGVDFIAINLAIPFMLLGIGLDDQFVINAVWHRTDPKKSVPERMAEAYSEAAASVTITSLTTMLSAFVGTMSSFPAVYYFTLYIGVCIFFLYLWFIFFYGGCLALAGYAEEAGKHSITCKKVTPKSESEGKSFFYRKFLAGGINKDAPYNEKDYGEQALPIFFRDYIAAFVNKKSAKIFILFVFLCYISGAIYGTFVLEEGLERRKMLLDESYLGEYFNDEDKMYRKYPYRIQIVIDQELQYTNPENKEKLLQIHDMFENSTYIGHRIFTTSWIRHFYRWIERKPQLKAKIHDEPSFIKVLKNDYLPRRKHYQLDVTFNKNETAIIASRFVVQAKWINNTEQDKEMMLKMREIASKAPFNTLTYHQFFAIFDQYLLIRMSTIQTVLMATVVMMVVSLIFIPNKLSCCGIAFSIISIELGIIGYMSLWGVALDGLSMVNLVICIGFSVDFSAHISYAFLTADATTPEERVRSCLYSLGLPVVQGGLSTIMAVVLLAAVGSYIYRIFFKIIFLVIFFGLMHAIFLLPVLLSILELYGVREEPPVSLTNLGNRESPVALKPAAANVDVRIDPDFCKSDKDLVFSSGLSSRHESFRDNNASNEDESERRNSLTLSNSQTLEKGSVNKACVDF